jgi:hypothetical protein
MESRRDEKMKLLEEYRQNKLQEKRKKSVTSVNSNPSSSVSMKKGVNISHESSILDRLLDQH